MNHHQQMVRDFHLRFGQPAPSWPKDLSEAGRMLRARLIWEEAREAVEALENPREDLAAIAGELADLLYVTYGTAAALGIDLEPHFAAVHAANMAKVAAPAGDPDQKVRKPAGWTPADHQAALRGQYRRPD